ncbi:MAG: MFS transporter [Myxococcota bacterium]
MVAGIIFAVILIDFLGFSLLIPVLPLYARQMGATPSQVGLMLSLYSIALVLFLPLWGWVSDRVGRRPVILVCLAGTAGSFALMAVAETTSTIYVARALGGLFGASLGTAQAYIADITEADDRARGMGLIGAAFGIGGVLGNAMGGLLYPIHPEAPFWVASGLTLSAFAVGVVLLPESRAAGTAPIRRGSLLRACVPTPLMALLGAHTSRNRLYFYLFFHIFAAFTALEAMFPLYAQAIGWSVWETGLFLAYIGLGVAVTQGLLIGPLIARFGEGRMVTVGLLLTGLGMLGFSVTGRLPLQLFTGALVASGVGIAFPTFTSLFSKVLAPDEAGEFLGYSQSMAQTGRALGPYWGGWAFLAIGATAPFWIGGLGVLASVVIFVAFTRLLMPDNPAPSRYVCTPAGGDSEVTRRTQ